MNTFATRLKDLRKQNKKYQKDIAELLDISERQYSSYEAGRVDPPSSKLIRLANYFDVSIDYLVGRSDDPKRY